MRKKILLMTVTLLFVCVFATSALATTCYTENGRTGTVYLYYDKTGSNTWGDYSFTDKDGNVIVPAVQWSKDTATVLPMNAKVFFPKDANGQYLFNSNDADMFAIIVLRDAAYQDKLTKLAQQQKAVVQQTPVAEEDDEEWSWEVPMSERPPGTEDWIWSKSRWAKDNWDREKYGSSYNSSYSEKRSNNNNSGTGYVQRIGNFDYYNFSNGKSGVGQRIGNFYYYNGW